MNYNELKTHCKSIEISVTAEQAKSVEKATREQANSKLWFRFGSERITASKMKSVCCTDPAMPAQSIIISICYPYTHVSFHQRPLTGDVHMKNLRVKFSVIE